MLTVDEMKAIAERCRREAHIKLREDVTTLDEAKAQAANAIDQLLAQIEPDMFWLADDPERPYDNPGDYFSEESAFGEPVEFMRAIQRSNAWAVAVPTRYEDADIVEDFDLHWFATEKEAEAFCETQKRGDGLPLVEAGK